MRDPDCRSGVLAIDAGNSKTDVALVAADGARAGQRPRRGFRPHVVGAGGRGRRARALVDGARRRRAAGATVTAGRRMSPPAWPTPTCRSRSERLEAAIAARRLGADDRRRQRHLRAAAGRARRAAAASPWSAAPASTASALLPDGRTARFPAVGQDLRRLGRRRLPGRGGDVVGGPRRGRPRARPRWRTPPRALRARGRWTR